MPSETGYYPSFECRSLHVLQYSDGRPNADFAPFEHPASYVTNGETKYRDYSAGPYLPIKLSKQAQIHGIAVQGSPSNLQHYLKSFEIS